MTAKYLYRKEPGIDFVQIAKEESGHYFYWNNRIKEWRENDPTAFGIFVGFEDGLYIPITEKEAQEIVRKYEQES